MAKSSNPLSDFPTLSFHSLADEYGLNLLYRQPFSSIFQQEIQVPEYRNHLKRQIGLDNWNNHDIPQDMWEAISE